MDAFNPPGRARTTLAIGIAAGAIVQLAGPPAEAVAAQQRILPVKQKLAKRDVRARWSPAGQFLIRAVSG
jgi:hypothetical protein